MSFNGIESKTSPPSSQSCLDNMAKYISLTIWASTWTVKAHSFCQFADCSIPTVNASTCSIQEFNEQETYFPLQQPHPAMKDPAHLFSMIYDHQEIGCIEVVFGVSNNDSQGFDYWMIVRCRTNILINAQLMFRVHFEQGSIACLRRNNGSQWIAKYCEVFARERLRLNFKQNRTQLLLEELSDQGKLIASLMLHRHVNQPNYTCKCTRLSKLNVKLNQCVSRELHVMPSKTTKRNFNFGLVLIAVSIGYYLLLLMGYRWSISGKF